MSTERLSDEQLDELADKVADRLGDDDSGTSTARTYGRRGVLAALGVAALGTGSASAQASGQVGTASSPVDVEGYDVTAQNSFTDPAGITHSGELANKSDIQRGFDRIVFKDSGDTVVAASDGTELQRDTDAATALQAAIDNLSDGSFFLRSGTYELSARLLIRGISLNSASRNRVTLKLQNGVNPSVGVLRAYNGSQIRNITIDGNEANNTSGAGYYASGQTEMTARNVKIKNTVDRSIIAEGGTTDVNVLDSVLDNGVKLASGTNGSVINCRITGGQINFVSWDGGTAANNRIDGGGVVNNILVCVEDGTQDIVFANNIIKAAAGNDRGITVGIGASDVTVSGNTVSNVDDAGITVDTVLSDGTVKQAKTSITGNTIRDCGSHGINIQNDRLVTVSGNTITNCNRGIAGNASSDASDHHTIVANTIEGCATYGISIASDSGVCGLNTVTGCGDGIRISGDEISTVANTIVNNSGTGALVTGADDNVSALVALRNSTNNVDTSGATRAETGGANIQ